MKNDSTYDANGVLILEGDWVMFTEAPASLLNGLPAEDQKAIKLQAGKSMQVIGFDEYGYVEMEFTEIDGTYHAIWIEPKKLFKIKSPTSTEL